MDLVGGLYRLALPALTNGQAFSYTLTLTVDAATAATTFTPKAQFFTSGGSTTGTATGPVITVTQPLPDVQATKIGVTYAEAPRPRCVTAGPDPHPLRPCAGC